MRGTEVLDRKVKVVDYWRVTLVVYELLFQ